MRNAADTMNTPSQMDAEQAEPEKGVRAFFTARTLFSALIFGAIGAGVGRLLGGLGEKGDHKLGRVVLSWVGGVGAAMLAAYTSTRTAQREHREDAEKRAAAITQAASTESADIAIMDGAKPASLVDAREYAGTLSANDRQRAI